MRGALTDAGPLTPQEPSRETSHSSIDGIEQAQDWPEGLQVLPGQAGHQQLDMGSPTPSGSSTPARVSPDSTEALNQHIVAGATRLRSAVEKKYRTVEQVSFVDLAQHPRLARRARAELDGRFSSPEREAMLNAQAHAREADLERQRAAIGDIEADAAEESRVNIELAGQLSTRLDASRRASERLLGTFQALANAEAVHSRALRAASHVNLVGDCDSAPLRTALQEFSELSYGLGQAKQDMHRDLADATATIQDIVTLVRKQAAQIKQDAARSHADIAAARRRVQTSFAEHCEACRQADAAAGSRVKVVLETDPWLTETRCVAAQAALHSAQAGERTLLTAAFEHIRTLESRRVAVVKASIEAFLHIYSGSLGHMQAASEKLQRHTARISDEQHLTELASLASAAAQTVEALAARQSAALEEISQELLASPEILRQGAMGRWISGTGRWQDCHFVLTRSGFLHWLLNAGDVVPEGTLALSRCAFEYAEAPELRLVESPSPSLMSVFTRGRTLRFSAPSVEESCEWAISLREIMASERRGQT